MTEVSATVSCGSAKNHILLKDTRAYFNLLSLSLSLYFTNTHTHTKYNNLIHLEAQETSQQEKDAAGGCMCKTLWKQLTNPQPPLNCFVIPRSFLHLSIPPEFMITLSNFSPSLLSRPLYPF